MAGLKWRPGSGTKRTPAILTFPVEAEFYYMRMGPGNALLTRQAYHAELEARERAKHHPPNPIQLGRKYLNILESEKGGTYDRVAKTVGVSRSKVFQHIALVKRLPQAFVEWLEDVDDKETLLTFAEFRLRPIAIMKDEKEQWAALRKLADEGDVTISTMHSSFDLNTQDLQHEETMA